MIRSYLNDLLPRLLLLLVFIPFLALVACLPTSGPETKASAKPESTSPDAQITWEQKWNDLIKAAQKEGRLSIYSGLEQSSIEAFRKNFGNRYGIDLQIVTGKSNELDPKIFTERQNGLYIPDLYVEGPTSPILVYKARGIVNPIDKVIFRPDVLDEKVWMQGFGPFFDRGHYLGGGTSTVQTAIIVNPNLVNPNELTSYNDLLQPKWKGKIVLGDPTVSGGAQSTMDSTLVIMGEDYIKQLAGQIGISTRDKRLVVEWVAREKYPIGFGAGTSEVTEFINAGAPVKMVAFKEGHGTTASGVVVLFDHAPNPNAAALFINWFLTKDAQQAYSIASGKMSRRLDVSTDHLQDAQKVNPGVRYVVNDEDYYLDKPKLDEVVAKYYR